MRRLVLAVLVLILVATVAAGAGGTYLVRRAFPQTTGTLMVSGLSRPVEVIRDRWGIPHLFAQSSRDLLFAQGFVHAQDRLWHMELNRRVASGRLSEIFGEAALSTDRFLRTIGLRRSAQAHLASLSEHSRANLEAYAAGVNAFMQGARDRLPIEFAFLRFAPEPWTPADTLVYGKLMAWVLGGDWRAEILREHLHARFGERALERLWPEYPEAPIIAPDATGTSAPAQDLPPRPGVPAPRGRRAESDRPQDDPPIIKGQRGLGSNNWVLAADRTTTGGPLLANDPHLEGQMPSVWYLMHLTDDRHSMAGATFPGVPGIIIGHNRDIAWGVTNANPDVQDLFVERFHPNDPSRYLYKGQWVPATVVRESIKVKGRKDLVVEVVRITRNGPVISNVVRGLNAYLALRWTALESSSIVEAVDAINHASSWEEFRLALRAWDAPSQNFVFAHRNGDIGYQMPGRIPIRARGTGAQPSPGWTGDFDWTGMVPFDALPSVRRRDGFIVSANNRIAPPGYPHFLGREWDPGFRARRITVLLSEGKHSVQTLQRIQTDVTSIPGKAVIGALQAVKITDPALQPLFTELLQWDGVLAASSRPAAVYEAFVHSLLKEVFRPLDDGVWTRYLRHYDAPVVALLGILADPSSGWWGGNRDRLVEDALRDAVRVLETRLGRDRGQWRWGRLHQPTFTHPIGRIKALAWVFNVTAPETGGDAFTVNNGAFDPEAPFRQALVASYRQILDPADWDRSLVIHTTGQSGLPFHRHYRDFTALWARGEYVPLLFSRQRIEEAAAGRLTLVPSNK
ncbi:MAG: penicillin acylase family protein [bacterium]